MNRTEYATLILERLSAETDRLREEFSRHTVQSCFVDDLLPKELALEIFHSFPDKSTMVLKKSLRENKYVAAQMDEYAPILEEIVYAFQDARVLNAVAEITEIRGMVPDDRLYAGGVSLMAFENFLNPHLDNSHDKDRAMYRVLNLLYYVTPDWSHEQGGNLELWDTGPKGLPRQITSHFNRLALMATHQKSWHSVSHSLVHDDVSPLSAPRHAAIRPGLYLSRVPGARRLDLRVEAADTDPPTGRSSGGAYIYTEFIQRQGYTNKGFLLGDAIGREDKGGQAWLTYHLSPQDQIQLSYRNGKAPLDFIPGGTTQNIFQVSTVKHFHRTLEVRGMVQYEGWKAPLYEAGRHTDVSASLQATWSYPSVR